MKTKNKINENRVIFENGEVKVILSEQIQKNGYMDVEESRRITLEAIKMIYEKNGRL